MLKYAKKLRKQNMNEKQKIIPKYYFIQKRGKKKMNDEIMANDILKEKKLELTEYASVIADTENMTLRNSLEQIRNTSESLQYELLKIAKIKGYYKQTEMASAEQISKVKSELE